MSTLKPLKNLPAGFEKAKTRSENFNWSKYCDGNWHPLRQGTQEEMNRGECDFISTLASFKTHAGKSLKALGYKMELATSEENPKLVYIMAIPMPGTKLNQKLGRKRGGK